MPCMCVCDQDGHLYIGYHPCKQDRPWQVASQGRKSDSAGPAVVPRRCSKPLGCRLYMSRCHRQTLLQLLHLPTRSTPEAVPPTHTAWLRLALWHTVCRWWLSASRYPAGGATWLQCGSRCASWHTHGCTWALTFSASSPQGVNPPTGSA